MVAWKIQFHLSQSLGAHAILQTIMLSYEESDFSFYYYFFLLCVLCFQRATFIDFICIKIEDLFVLRFYGSVNPMGSCRAWSVLPNHTFTGQALSSKRLASIVHILLPEIDNCPSQISRRERMTVENISRSISTKACCLIEN